jgi:hypothetical protein
LYAFAHLRVLQFDGPWVEQTPDSGEMFTLAGHATAHSPAPHFKAS